VITDILERIENKTLPLPSMPIAVARCMALLRENDFSLRQAARVIEKDPLLASRVLAVSNSVTFGGLAPVRNIVQAAIRLGADNLRLVLFEVVASHLFVSVDDDIRATCDVLWQHSRAVASTSRHLTLVVGAGDPSEAYLAGLLHDVGKPIVLSLLGNAENPLFEGADVRLDPDTLMAIVQDCHRLVGAALAKNWLLPETVVSSVANCSAYDEREPCSIVNCVRLANALAKEAGPYVGPAPATDLHEVVRAGQSTLHLTDDDLNGMRNELRDASDEGGAEPEAVGEL